MDKLFCSSCSPKMIDNGEKIIYECRVRTSTNFEYTDWYKEPKDVGYHEIVVQMRKFNIDGKKKYVPVARLGSFISD